MSRGVEIVWWGGGVSAKGSCVLVRGLTTKKREAVTRPCNHGTRRGIAHSAQGGFYQGAKAHKEAEESERRGCVKHSASRMHLVGLDLSRRIKKKRRLLKIREKNRGKNLVRVSVRLKEGMHSLLYSGGALAPLGESLDDRRGGCCAIQNDARVREGNRGS